MIWKGKFDFEKFYHSDFFLSIHFLSVFFGFWLRKLSKSQEFLLIRSIISKLALEDIFKFRIMSFLRFEEAKSMNLNKAKKDDKGQLKRSKMPPL